MVLLGLPSVISCPLMSDGVLDIGWIAFQKLEMLRISTSLYDVNTS